MSVRLKSIPNLNPKAALPIRVPTLKTVPYAVQDVRLFQGKWEECGCPRSTANRVQKVDLTPRRHDHMVALDESVLHYIFDRRAYLKITRAPQDSPLAKWCAHRCREGRLFVAKPPTKPASSEPWRYDSPPKLGLLASGWRVWDPNDIALTYSKLNSVAEYREHLDTFFLWLNIVGVMKSEMMESGEAWMLACGEETDHLKVKNRRPCKIDRCFVTCDMAFFELVMAKWDRMSFFTRSIRCGEKMKYMRRIMDIRLDPFTLQWPLAEPDATETGVDPCEPESMPGVQHRCHIHGQDTLRRNIRTAPAEVPRGKMLSPRARPRTRARKLDATRCSGKGWSPSQLTEKGFVTNWHI